MATSPPRLCVGGMIPAMTPRIALFRRCLLLLALAVSSSTFGQTGSTTNSAIVLHAARLLEIETGKVIAPGEVLVQGDRIVEVASNVKRPTGAHSPVSASWGGRLADRSGISRAAHHYGDSSGSR
jgi:hypothetical protein